MSLKSTTWGRVTWKVFHSGGLTWFVRNLRGWSQLKPAQYTSRSRELRDAAASRPHAAHTSPSIPQPPTPISRMRQLAGSGFQPVTYHPHHGSQCLHNAYLKMGSLCCPLPVNNRFDMPAIFFPQHTLKCITTQMKYVWMCTMRIPLGSILWKITALTISKKPTTVSWKTVIEGQSLSVHSTSTDAVPALGQTRWEAAVIHVAWADGKCAFTMG